MLKQNQYSLIIYWVVLVAIAEIIMFLFNAQLFVIYAVVAGLFLVGFILRVFNLYPGKREPLVLDFSAVIVALLYAYLAKIFQASNLRFLLILTSSLIIVPHLIYIVANERLGGLENEKRR